MQIIYFNLKPLFLATEINNDIEDYSHRKTTILIDELDENAVKTMIEQMENPNVYAGIFLHEDEEELVEAFKKHFTVIQTGGGLVKADDNEILLIYRRGKWDLPKGKLDKGEDVETCAIREVEEETGIERPELIHKIATTYHTYHEKDEHILKENHWYLMKAEKKKNLKPQSDEGIEKCEWVKLNEAGNYYDNMLPSIKDIINNFITNR